MTLVLLPYQCWVFDCDGVLLDSNKVKNAAFHELAMPWGLEVAAEFVAWHKANGGLSRFVKVRHLVDVLLGRAGDEALIAELLARFGALVRRGLFDAPLIPGCVDLLSSLPVGAQAWVVSGGLQEEVREALCRKELGQFFKGMFGSPMTKDEILEQIGAERVRGGVYFGDALYDQQVAARFGLDFVFVRGASDHPEVAASCAMVVEDLTGIEVRLAA